ncbi:MAG TPA: formylglycine-generating enzyme family protein [Tepidisphaeraceae bacterium]|jgi:formylglycine-generating enzyme required for sulfatase activity
MILRAPLLLLLLPVLAFAAGNAPPSTQPADMVLVPGGTFRMGTNDGFPYEGPVHEVKVNAFWMDKHEVTNADFGKFVKATGFKTDAEKFGWSGVFDAKTGKWSKSDGADWRHPFGPDSEAKPNEPVVHVSYADAEAYAKWAGKRLPTEAEFEFAARGGKQDEKFAWGNDLYPDGKQMANAWQGIFPLEDTGKDGFKGLAPVGSFPANPYGLVDITGNVWEWTSDFFDPEYYKHSPTDNPKGPSSGNERVLRGGSWLCAENYCLGYRVAARNHTEPDSGLNNLGFRCVKDAGK